MRYLIALAFCFASVAAFANTARSQRPLPRVVVAAPAGVGAQQVHYRAAEAAQHQHAPKRSLRPLRREGTDLRASVSNPNSFAQQLRKALSERPVKRDGFLKLGRRGMKGAVCGDPDIKGQKIAPITGKAKGCGLSNGVKIHEVDGITLTQHATIDCTTAKALKSWVRNGVKPAIGKRGGGLKSLKVVAHYVCRTRNSQRGAKVSEHGRGRALDVAAFHLRDGTSVSVLEGWRKRRDGRLLRQMHKAACGPFGTVLGPQSDRFHQDHFHLDTARYRSGAYCR